MLPSCSWCHRDVPGERVPFTGHDASVSSVGLCDTCLLLGGLEHSSLYVDGSASWKAWSIAADLVTEPHHETGCAFCGRAAAELCSWWPDRREDRASISLQLCDVCPGLLELADAPDRARLWTRRLRAACRIGMQDRLGQEAQLPALPAPKQKAKPPRLTESHREMLETIRRAGVMDAFTFHRDAGHGPPQHRIAWWQRRIADLFAHRLVTPVTNPPGAHPINTVRILDDEERELEHRVYTWHVPGPIWDGQRVYEPVAPEGWLELEAQLTALRAERDGRALALRTRVRSTG
ncbi:hypothetical protein PUR49_07945 [Streptomyces sp. BE147]|uniref:hypothetical protein n=1 Tax=Streptomyces sp. BE147 TaxID=3002524 RepID=UPI002E768BA3|nr:hypothetical protein [Streptomyces sp. BE147]MEE1736430.1 hypothetical protein [Streptomyces sp. BE147]